MTTEEATKILKHVRDNAGWFPMSIELFDERSGSRNDGPTTDEVREAIRVMLLDVDDE